MEMWFSEFHTPDVKHSIRVNRQLFSRQSDYQRIDIFETPEFGRVLTLDGNVMLTERDEFIYDEMITHVPMAIHKEAKDILVIGAGDGGVVRELTRYDRVNHIDLVEMDPMVVEACRAYLPGNACRLDDRRVHLHYENALKYIRIFRPCHIASFCLGIFNIIQDFRGDSFPWSQNRDSRRITHYKFAAYLAFCFSERKAAFFSIKSFLGTCHYLRIDIFLIQ